MVKSEAGFSSVEVIVATLLLSVGVLGAARASADMTRVLSASDRLATAAVHSQERMERLRALGCDALTNGSETKDGGVTISWTISQNVGAQSKTIGLSTSYPGAKGVQTVELETSLSCR